MTLTKASVTLVRACDIYLYKQIGSLLGMEAKCGVLYWNSNIIYENVILHSVLEIEFRRKEWMNQ